MIRVEDTDKDEGRVCMKKILLTSAGFENKVIETKFLELVSKSKSNIRALWIPTASIDDEAKAVLPKCMDDLLNAGISKENITIYDLDKYMTYDEITNYDVIYVCGGDSRYLLDKMYEANFVELLRKYVDNGGVYVGVSAGSWICAKGFDDNLGFLKSTLSVHCNKGTPTGKVDFSKYPHINLTDAQAIVFENETVSIIE